ncbi:MAG: TIGR01777 family oxidoreductase [Pyrinomonadaceae bacterium]
MKILITGASGLVGSKLVEVLKADRHEILKMVRRESKSSDEVSWDVDRGEIDIPAMKGVDAVVHLAGENVGEGRWTDAKKKSIMDSRVLGTRLIVEAIGKLDPRPHVLISASAVGIYGSRGSEIVTEASLPGSGFLAQVCRKWEAETVPAVEQGIRVVNLRVGVVLSNDGGALAKLLTPFKLGVGGKVGSGRQYLSWLTLNDLVQIIVIALTNESYIGPINAVTPEPVTNQELTDAIGKKLSRPTFMSVPEFAVKLLFGQMGEETVLSSTRALPARLEELGFKFQYPTINSALDLLLKE